MVVELGIDDFLQLFTEQELSALRHRQSNISLFNDVEDTSEVATFGVLTVLAGISTGPYFILKKKKLTNYF